MQEVNVKFEAERTLSGVIDRTSTYDMPIQDGTINVGGITKEDYQEFKDAVPTSDINGFIDDIDEFVAKENGINIPQNCVKMGWTDDFEGAYARVMSITNHIFDDIVHRQYSFTKDGVYEREGATNSNITSWGNWVKLLNDNEVIETIDDLTSDIRRDLNSKADYEDVLESTYSNAIEITEANTPDNNCLKTYIVTQGGTNGTATKAWKINIPNVTKAQVGLGNVDNTADTDKPISTATQTALDTKADKSEIIPNDNVKVTGKLIDKIGWYRLASFKGTGNASTQGSSCNSCEIILQRSFGTHSNEYHHIYFTGIYQARQFNSISNKSNSYLLDKIRYVEVKDENNILTSYIDIYNYVNSNNNFHYKILNSANNINLSWKPCFEYVGTDDISGQVVYTIPANSELAQKEIILFDGSCEIPTGKIYSDPQYVSLSDYYNKYKYIGIDYITSIDCGKPRAIINVDNASQFRQFDEIGVSLDGIECIGDPQNRTHIGFYHTSNQVAYINRIVGIK